MSRKISTILSRWWSRLGLATNRDLQELKHQIMKTQVELAAQLQQAATDITATNATLAKVGVETTKTLEAVTALQATVADLQAQLANATGVSPELQAIADTLTTQAAAAAVAAKTVDDMVPDSTAAPAADTLRV